MVEQQQIPVNINSHAFSVTILISLIWYPVKKTRPFPAVRISEETGSGRRNSGKRSLRLTSSCAAAV